MKVEKKLYNKIRNSVNNHIFLIKGVSQEERDAKMHSINAEYNSMRATLMSQGAALSTLVTKFPYRILSSKSPNKKVSSITQKFVISFNIIYKLNRGQC